MATKIEVDGSIIKVNAENGERIAESIIVHLIGTSYIYCKVGPIWLVRPGEECVQYNDENYNITASEFFIDDIFGPALIISNYEAPAEWLEYVKKDIDLDNELGDNADDIDESFIQALMKKSNNLGAYTLLEENLHSDEVIKYSSEIENLSIDNQTMTEFERRLFDNDAADIAVSHYFYNPNSDFSDRKRNKKFRDFLITSYDSVVDSIKLRSDSMILYRDALQIVKVNKADDKIKTVDQIIELLIEDDEFEKCATLRDLIKIIK